MVDQASKQRLAELNAESTRQILGMSLSSKRSSKHQLSETGKAWIALIPACIFLLAFMIYPILNTFIMSFIENFRFMKGAGGSFALSNFFAALSNSRLSTKPSFSFQNYIVVLQDADFLTSLGNTALIVIVTVPLTIVVALLIAVAMNSIKPLKGFFQTVFFLPYVTNAIALGMVFKIIFTDGDAGLFNAFLSLFGVSAQSWLSVYADKWQMFVVIIIYSIWNGIAFKILVFMSGLASIDNQYYDAAKIDGANKATILGRITVPLLSPQILYITITSFIGAFKSYTQIISLFGAGAYNFGGSTGKNWMTVVGYIYSTMQDDTMVGRAAAASFVLLVIILIITLLQTVASKRRVHY
ncbi:MAG: sugar ABC transporter permease [Bacilli bacterium]|nr:sugar ABC transporter permease [Bacilli bacterium]